jgi:4-carboxymuconolactone decarboxylase
MSDDFEKVASGYRDFFGEVPPALAKRFELAEKTGTLEAAYAIEQMRTKLIYENPLGAHVQQLVHFGQLLALGKAEPARLHARTALRHGATISELVGVVLTSLITAGVPAYSLGVDIVAELAGDVRQP